ncbi:MAG: DUF92 domain-containing protein [Chloroflexi bacterium]|nr:DUF92 domain-containing protein [Chloroflexota bacterium]
MLSIFSGQQLILGLGLSLVIAAAGYRGQSLSSSGALGAVLIGTTIFGFGGWIWGWLLIAFFITSSGWSHYRAQAKSTVAEKFSKGSRRDIGQVFANGGWAALVALAYAVTLRNPSLFALHPLLFGAFLGTIGTVTADTWATEIGVLSRHTPRLITTWSRVPPGTSGGITALGTLAALVGALTIGVLGVALIFLLPAATTSQTLSPGQLLLCATMGGLAGSLFDSWLGATIQVMYYCPACQKETERRIHRCGSSTLFTRGWRWLDNDWVNLISSIFGSMVGLALAVLAFPGFPG